MTRQPSELDKVAEAWVDKMAEMSPSFSTYIGKKGGEDKLDDASPEAQEEDVRQMRRVLAEVNATTPQDKVDEVTKDAMRNSLELGIEIHEAGLWKRDLNVIASPAQGIRDIFDLSPTATEHDWENLAKRMRAVEGAVDGYIRTLRLGIEAGDTPAKRQVEFNIKLAEGIAAADGFFNKFAASAKAGDSELPASLKDDVVAAGHAATEGYAKLLEFFKLLS